MFNIISHWGNGMYNFNEIPPDSLASLKNCKNLIKSHTSENMTQLNILNIAGVN